MYRIRSCRRLERECHKNIEVLWLLHRLAPDDKHHLIVAVDVVQSAVDQDQLYRMPGAASGSSAKRGHLN